MERDQAGKRQADSNDQAVPRRQRLNQQSRGESPEVEIVCVYNESDQHLGVLNFTHEIEGTIPLPRRKQKVVKVEEIDTAPDNTSGQAPVRTVAAGSAPPSKAPLRKIRQGVSDGGGGEEYWADKYYEQNPFVYSDSRPISNHFEQKILKDLGPYDAVQKRALERASDYFSASRGDLDVRLKTKHNETVMVLGNPEEFTPYLGFLSNKPETQLCKEKGFPVITFEQMMADPKRFFGEHTIMFVFPTDRKSQVRPDAPTLTVFDIRTIMSHIVLHQRYVDTVMTYLETIRITFKRDQEQFWYCPEDRTFFTEHFKDTHNLKRMCRLLRSLKILHPFYAVQLLQMLQDMLYQKIFSVTQGSLALWMGEVNMSSTLSF